MNSMNKERQDTEKSHYGRIKGTAAAEEREEEGNQEEDEQKRIFFNVFDIIVKNFVKEEAIDHKAKDAGIKTGMDKKGLWGQSLLVLSLRK